MISLRILCLRIVFIHVLTCMKTVISILHVSLSPETLINLWKTLVKLLNGHVKDGFKSNNSSWANKLWGSNVTA